MPTAVWALEWIDVDPARHCFDRARIADIVNRVVQDEGIAKRLVTSKRQRFEDDVDRALMSAEGAWLAGWRWAASEPGCGGIVQSYCCADHSLGGAPEELAETVVAAVSDLRTRLEELAEHFRTWDEEVSELDDGGAASHIASRLLPIVLEWTRVEDAWYSTFELILAWALERRGVAANQAKALVHEAVGGRFHSWLEPGDGPSRAVFEDLAHAMRQPREQAPDDALEAWLDQRERVRWERERTYHPGPAPDGHRLFIDEVDRGRDESRATRLLAALDEVRRDARSGATLTLERLTGWQSLVLGAPAAFRSEVALAHGGNERYGLLPDIEQRFGECLAQALDPETGVIACAARAYLDVCFFHPFPDGNARSARLVLDFILTRAGLSLHTAHPVFRVARRSSDTYMPYSLMYILDYLSGPSLRRS